MWLQFGPYCHYPFQDVCELDDTQILADFPTHHRPGEPYHMGFFFSLLLDLHVMQVSTNGELGSASEISVTVQACLLLYLSINCCTMH